MAAGEDVLGREGRKGAVERHSSLRLQLLMHLLLFPSITCVTPTWYVPQIPPPFSLPAPAPCS